MSRDVMLAFDWASFAQSLGDCFWLAFCLCRLHLQALLGSMWMLRLGLVPMLQVRCKSLRVM